MSRRSGRLKSGAQLASSPQEQDVEGRLRHSEERGALRPAGASHDAKLQRLSSARVQFAQGGSEPKRVGSPTVLGGIGHLHGRSGGFLEAKGMLSTLAPVRRIVPLLGICLMPVHAGAVETLRIAMEDPGATAEVSGKSLSIGQDDEEADF